MEPIKASWSSLDRALSLHVAAMTALGAVIVGLRHETPWLPAAAAIAPIVAVVVTDARKMVRLNRWVANAITVVAVGWSLRNFLEMPSEEKLMAIGSMLCFLQIVLLFQEKTGRIYWHLVVLSVLDVVVAAALGLGPHYVPLVGLFLTTGLSTLMLLGVYREVGGKRNEPWLVTKWFPFLKYLNANGRSRNAAEDVPYGNKMLLAGPRVERVGSDEAALARAFPMVLFVRQTVLLTGVTLLFAMAFFYATPRLQEFSPNRSWGGAIAGFRTEVQLERKGRIHLSSRPVMRVQLSRLSDRRPVELVGEPYFHGVRLTDYKADEERWLPSATRAMRAVPQTTRNLVRQDIVLETNVSRRFAIEPTQPVSDENVTYGAGRGGADRAQQQRYAWATPAIVNEQQVRAIPNPNRRRTDDEEAVFNEELKQARNFPEARFGRLTEVAAEVLEQNQLAEGRAFDKAIALERHFLAAGQYKYTLNLDLSNDESIDPIEDFVANARAGHCEYFASGLAMMLRSQGIPARLVRGYKGGAFNSVGKYYLVQERDAHSWVEAWLPNEEVPPTEFAGAASEGGVWYRFDPTPGRSNQVTLETQGFGNRLAQAFDYVELLWRDYVLSLNTSRQDEIVYAPLTAHVGALPQWVELRVFRQWLRRTGAMFGMDIFPRGGRGARVFEGWAAVVVIVGLMTLVAAAYAARWLWITFWRWRAGQGKQANRSPEFYRRLERLVARMAVVRKRGQTPREMAKQAGARLAMVPGHVSTSGLPGKLVAAYYRVRFGNGRLDKVESEAIEQALVEIEGAVRRVKRN